MSEDLNKELSDIFSEACKAMKHKLQDKENVTAADLNAVLGFLKHNGITAVPAKNSPLGDLAEAAEQAGHTIKFPFPASAGSLLPEDDPAVTSGKAGANG